MSMRIDLDRSRVPNARIKHYPGYDHYTVFNFSPFKAKKPASCPFVDEEFMSDSSQVVVDLPHVKRLSDSVSRSDSVHRAKTKVYDICMLNDFRFFCTFTFDASCVDRESASDCRAAFRSFTKALRRANSDFGYLAIPEHHADGKAIHIHALFTDVSGVPSGHFTSRSNGERVEVLNVPGWRFGFSTAIPMDDNKLAVSKYITKYVTKDMQKIFGNFYLAGGVDRVVPEERVYIPFTNFPGYCINLVDGLAVKYLEVSLDASI